MLPPAAIEGNLVDDPVLRFTPSGAAVCNFRIVAKDRKRNSDTGAWEDGEPFFVTCTTWRQQAEHVANSLSKGDRVVVLGQFVQRDWEDKDGNKRTNYEVRVFNVGASLTFHDVTIKRTERTTAPVEDQWADATGGAGKLDSPW